MKAPLPGIDNFLEAQFAGDEERQAVKRELDAVQSIGRMNTMQEVADAMVFLASPRQLDSQLSSLLSMPGPSLGR